MYIVNNLFNNKGNLDIVTLRVTTLNSIPF